MNGFTTLRVSSTNVDRPSIWVIFRLMIRGSHQLTEGFILTGFRKSFEAFATGGYKFHCHATNMIYNAASSGGASFLKACRCRLGTPVCMAPTWPRPQTLGSVFCVASSL